MSAEQDDRGELALLAGALRRHLRRERDRGRRRLPATVQAMAPGAHVGPQPKSAAGDPVVAAASPASAPPARPSAVSSGEATPAELLRPSPAAARPPAPQPAVTAPVSEPSTAAVAQAAADLDALGRAVASCRACSLCESRNQTVFADGDPQARVMFVGEAPGADEDLQGTPFVGRAGQLLTDIITKGMGLARGDVYIANVLKCRPPGNRDPQPEEKRLCTPFLERQIELVDPQVLIPLGRHAAQHLLGSDAPMGRLRGRVHRHRGRAVVPTFHPAYLLRSPDQKRATWEDIQLAMREIGLPIPQARRSREDGRG
ncbi:uracil-DNA glycosylase [Engelhardtia mirabilis]|uniref:Type-4 uracil-DNA glycosylase n=1 Tax=Engelhardtia mirabilis TaxID=2528011 RepID=A0A518BI59_9BACT|nr:Uracil DNA glycosylase superfamily protein [Planctomycetes bacterium Pla133]QDV00995.1 Uracil DNA glycosylase superfamily protein [Planctomycetes bacterium Pla86]